MTYVFIWKQKICFDSLISEGYDKVYSLVIDQYPSHAKVEEI